IGDVIARYQRMLGKNVLQPIGWDAFGLPAENAAIQNQTAPAKWTYKNIASMKTQFKSLGFAYDWSREVTTCKPEYYRWEQWFFTELYKKGLVYRKTSSVNWCPNDQTVLANEQVEDGRCWRCDAEVVKKEIPQWSIKITEYAEELLNDLDKLDAWPDTVKTMQRNWIGRSEGAEFSLNICDVEGARVKDLSFDVYTTRPDTSFGMTYCVLAPEHPLVEDITSELHQSAVQEFIEQARNASEIERLAEGSMNKRGVFTGAYAMNPFTKKPVPVYIADYVLMSYGTGAIMAVPGQDQRDWDFALAYDLPIIRTVQAPEDFPEDQPYTGDGVAINSDWLNGLNVAQAKVKAIDWLVDNQLGQRKVNYRLRDWGVSRQRYWGCPIPMIFCEHCGEVPVPTEDLPVILPEDVAFTGVNSPIKDDPEWRKVQCPDCGRNAERETDTFDTFVESSWYYARYTCPDADGMLDERANYWLPIDQYVGGIEHAVMHLLYFRFWHKLMRDAGLVDSDEPAIGQLSQGMVLADAYYYENETEGKVWVPPSEVHMDLDEKGKGRNFRDANGNALTHIGMTKMSKSKNNGVDPQAMIDKYGADTMRLYCMFASPPEQTMEWSNHAVEGASRFLRKIWRAITAFTSENDLTELDLDKAGLNSQQKDLRRQLHQTYAKVSDDYARRYAFNTAIAALMELFNATQNLNDNDANTLALKYEVYKGMTLMLSPIVPHIAQALWEMLGNKALIIDAAWPEVDESALVQESFELVVQVNGKVR
ncbi:MAG: leucine--tRNA ligase, partial [Gammaproteobacteria bacterium]|nr:leucine--tRNA ligase [Gammaproteobacteria bacterium]